MKKLLAVVGLLVVAVLAVPIANWIQSPPVDIAPLNLDAKSPEAQVALRLETSCGHCHVAGAKTPFYANLPGAHGMISQDKALASAAFQLTDAMPGVDPPIPSEVALARIERELAAGAMPPSRYVALHWNAALTESDRTLLRNWITEKRKRHFAAPGVPEKVAVGVLQPLSAPIGYNEAKVALGEKLYHDTRLSGDNTLSCASCHALDKGGTDQAPVSTGIRGQKGGINSPTTFNASLQVRQFWDGRAGTVEEQAAGPVTNPIEMGATWAQVMDKLGKDKALVAQFKALYKDGLQPANVTDAIGTFERTLITTNSRFDRFLKGDQAALTEDEKRGHAAFVERGCATCHVGKLLGGQSFEKMGRRADYFSHRGGALTDADAGRFNFTKKEPDRGQFKVPTLRNVQLTHPYFHDGSVADLKQAVVTMASVQLGQELPDQEARDITAFLGSLTGEYKGRLLQ